MGLGRRGGRVALSQAPREPARVEAPPPTAPIRLDFLSKAPIVAPEPPVLGENGRGLVIHRVADSPEPPGSRLRSCDS
jgi:hypothetical protein